MKATGRCRRLYSRGFTLVEMMMVIVLVAILAALATTFYSRHARKARVSSYAEPYARACLMDILTWCAENPGANIDPADLNNCASPQSSAMGNVTIDTSGATGQTCSATGYAPDGISITATLENVTDYAAVCETASGDVKCRVSSSQSP